MLCNSAPPDTHAHKKRKLILASSTLQTAQYGRVSDPFFQWIQYRFITNCSRCMLQPWAQNMSSTISQIISCSLWSEHKSKVSLIGIRKTGSFNLWFIQYITKQSLHTFVIMVSTDASPEACPDTWNSSLRLVYPGQTVYDFVFIFAHHFDVQKQ